MAANWAAGLSDKQFKDLMYDKSFPMMRRLFGSWGSGQFWGARSGL